MRIKWNLNIFMQDTLSSVPDKNTGAAGCDEAFCFVRLDA